VQDSLRKAINARQKLLQTLDAKEVALLQILVVQRTKMSKITVMKALLQGTRNNVGDGTLNSFLRKEQFPY